MKLSKRLSALAKLVDINSITIDIGSDHALLPIYLVINNISKKAYAVDNKVGPLNRAKDNINKYDVIDKVIPILSDGFNSIKEENFDTVTISGMGGDLIVEILSNPLFKNDKTLILAGNNDYNLIIEYLVGHNYQIVDEVIVYEDNIYYFIIKAKPTNSRLDLSNLEIEYGPINIKRKDELLIQFLNRKIDILNDGLSKSKDNKELLSKITNLKEALDEIRNNN